METKISCKKNNPHGLGPGQAGPEFDQLKQNNKIDEGSYEGLMEILREVSGGSLDNFFLQLLSMKVEEECKGGVLIEVLYEISWCGTGFAAKYKADLCTG
ncbi:unnamed protein product [Vicia faba]|uniref:Uncharacterized protein n=1 Tax=Vicia faba TaxID=3906 RepID=A0AAV0YQH9_VICFA|nr:unnamed protein product [Vicia faba]